MNQVKVGAILSYVSLFVSTFLGFVYTPFLLGKLGPSEFGLFSLASSVIAYLTLFDFGFGNAVARFTAKYRAEGKRQEMNEMLGMFFLLYCGIALLVALVGLCVYASVDEMFGAKMTTEELVRSKIIVAILVGNLVFTFPLFMFGSVVTAFENFIFQKVIHIVRILLQTAIMIPLLFWGFKAVALAVLITIMNFGTLIATAIYCLKKIKIRLIFTNLNWSLLKDIGRYSFFVFLGVVAERVCWSSGQFILGHTAGTSSVAVYAVAIRIVGFYTAMATAIPGVLLPKITGMAARNSSEDEMNSLFIRSGRIQFFIVGTAFFGFLSLGRPFLVLWAGTEYSDAYWVTILMMGALLPTLIQSTGVVILQAMNRLKFRSVLHISVTFFGLTLGYVLAGLWGGVGCAIGIACAFLLGNGLILNYYYRKSIKLDIPRFWKNIFRISLPLILISALLYAVDFFVPNSAASRFFVKFLLFVSLVCPAYWLFSMNEYEKSIFSAWGIRIRNRVK